MDLQDMDEWNEDEPRLSLQLVRHSFYLHLEDGKERRTREEKKEDPEVGLNKLSAKWKWK